MPPVKPAGIIGSPYDPAKLEAYVAANVDKRGYINPFGKKVIVDKADINYAKRQATKKSTVPTEIDIAGLQTTNGGIYNTALKYQEEVYIAEPGYARDVPVVLQRADGSRVIIQGDKEIALSLARGDTRMAVRLITVGEEVKQPRINLDPVQR